jgi:hypothetical protein
MNFPRLFGRAGRIGPHVESHEPRLLASNFVNVAVDGYLVTNVTHGITRFGMDYNDDLGCCGFAAWDHNNVCKLGLASYAGKTFTPPYANLALAYYAYGIAQGEPGPRPDQGVSNAAMMAWGYKNNFFNWRDATGKVHKGGYGEVPLAQLDWWVKEFNGVICGAAINDQQAISAFNRYPRGVWDKMTDITGGHDWVACKGNGKGGGTAITWGGLINFTEAFRNYNIQDCWVIFDKDDPRIDRTALEAALVSVHGVTE